MTEVETPMTESEVMRIQYEAIKKYCRGNKELALRISGELGSHMREYFGEKTKTSAAVEELCDVIGSAASGWQ